MHRLLRYISKPIQQLPLGRWKITKKHHTQWKIDMANTDHCGYSTTSDLYYYNKSLKKPKKVDMIEIMASLQTNEYY